MKKKEYLKPAMRVVKIQHTGMLMTSGLDASRTNYGTANDDITDGINSDGEWLWN
jgi:hypothetical protein